MVRARVSLAGVLSTGQEGGHGDDSAAPAGVKAWPPGTARKSGVLSTPGVECFLQCPVGVCARGGGVGTPANSGGGKRSGRESPFNPPPEFAGATPSSCKRPFAF